MLFPMLIGKITDFLFLPLSTRLLGLCHVLKTLERDKFGTRYITALIYAVQTFMAGPLCFQLKIINMSFFLTGCHHTTEKAIGCSRSNQDGKLQNVPESCGDSCSSLFCATPREACIHLVATTRDTNFHFHPTGRHLVSCGDIKNIIIPGNSLM